MSVGIEPYLGTGLAEMLAQRGIEARQSRLRQQEAMAPIIARAQMEAMAGPNLISAITGDPAAAQRARQGLAGMLSGFGMQPDEALGAPQREAMPAADMTAKVPGTDFTIGQLLATQMPGVGPIVQEQLKLPVQFAKEEMSGAMEAVKAAQAENLAAQQIGAQIANIRSQIPGSDPGVPAKAFALANKERLAAFFQSPQSKALQTSLVALYNQYRQTIGNRLFSSEAPTQLQPDMVLSGEQIVAMLDSLERAQAYSQIYSTLLSEELQRRGGRLSAAEIVKLQKETADYVKSMQGER